MTALARIEAVLATRMAAAEAGGALPFLTAGGMASHSYWSRARARALSRAGRLANERSDIADAWLKGAITCEHVDVAAKGVTGLEPEKASTVLDGLTPLWGRVAPSTVATYCARARTIVDPPSADEDVAAQKAHEARFLSFSVLDDTVHIAGALARLDGEMLMNVLHSTVEKTRVAGDGLTRSQRRADALIQLAAAQPMEGHGAGGGPAISVTVTSGLGAVTGSGHALTDDETRFALCDPAIATLVTEGSVATPCATRDPFREGVPGAAFAMPGGAEPAAPPAEACGPDPGTPDARRGASCAGLAALTAQALNSPQPLALGRTQRVASASQRRALAVRDGGCIMPGCEVTAGHCQIHHLKPWTAGGCTDLPNLVSLCWAHHRQVDLGRWDIRATETDSSAVDGMAAGEMSARPPPWNRRSLRQRTTRSPG